ncbi:MAG: murein biosynthesis integral membrane protein MurJ [Clostridiales bacterium]|nr:murein biosynthesis integral membrane protein MurJ [Clostridiales bacterium]
MGKTAVLLMILAIISKIVGFVRELILSYFYGASNISDAYLISLTIPNVIFSLVGTSLYTGYVPIYSQIKQDHGKKKADRFTNNLTNAVLIICTIIAIFGFTFTELLVKLFASGFTGDTLELAVRFTKFTIWGIYFTALVYIYGGFIRLQGNYVVPELPVFFHNAIIISSILLSVQLGMITLPIGALIALTSQFIVLYPSARKNGLRYRPMLDIRDENIKKMMIMALPVIVGGSVDQINVLIDRTLASNIAVGGISALNYASRLNGSIFAIFVNSISTVIYPIISKRAAENDIDGLKDSVRESINMLSLLLIPASLGTALYAKPIVIMLFGRGAFDSQAIEMTSAAFLCYSFGTYAFGLRNILSKAFYSIKDTRTPMINATISVLLNIVLNIVLSRYIGIGGLALGTSISAIICVILLIFSLRKKIGALGLRKMLRSLIKIIFAAAVMGIITMITFNQLQEYLSMNISLVCSIGLGVLVYFVLVFIMKIDEVKTIINLVKSMKNTDEQ